MLRSKMTDKTKRLRTTNFTDAEEDLLLICILRHAKVVESKRSDTHTAIAKNKAWEAITLNFNARRPTNVARHTKALKDKYTNIKTIMRRHLHAERANRRAGKEWNRSESTTEPQPRRSEPMIELERLIINSIHTTAPLCDDDDDPCYEPPDIPMPFHIADPLNMVPAPSDDFNILRPENVLRLAEHIKLEAEYSDDNSGETVTGNTGGGATSSSSNHHDHQAAASSSDHSSSTPHWDQYKSPGTHLKRPLDGLSGGTENGSAAPLLQLKRKLLERELAMREEEHEKRMELIALQRTELQIKLQITTLAYEELLAKRSGSFSADK